MDWWSQTSCPDWPTMWSQDVAADNPSVVLMHVGFWDTFASRVDGQYIRTGTLPGDLYFPWRLQEAYNRLSVHGATVVALPIPCFAPTIPPVLGHTLNFAVWRADRVNQLLQVVAATHPGGFVLLDYHPTICPGGQFTCSVKRADPK